MGCIALLHIPELSALLFRCCCLPPLRTLLLQWVFGLYCCWVSHLSAALPVQYVNYTCPVQGYWGRACIQVRSLAETSIDLHVHVWCMVLLCTYNIGWSAFGLLIKFISNTLTGHVPCIPFNVSDVKQVSGIMLSLWARDTVVYVSWVQYMVHYRYVCRCLCACI